MSIGLFVEGSSDKKAIPILIHKILEVHGSRQKCICRNLRGKGNILNAKKIQGHWKALLEQDSDIAKVIVCVDSDCDPAGIQEKALEIERELNKMGLPIRYAVVVHALEGWLAADSKALERLLGRQVQIKRNLEEECKPAEWLENLFARRGKNFQKTRDDPRIAEHVDPREIAKHSSSFRRFCQLVKDP
jgi:hypothetical protein